MGADHTEAETPDPLGAYPRLDDRQLSLLAAVGQERVTAAGEVLYREGDRTCDFHVVLDGLVAVVEEGDGEHLLGIHGRGRFLGELNLLSGQAVFETAVVREPGGVLVVPVDRLRDLLAHEPELGDVVLRAYIVRRSALLDVGAGLRIIGSRFSAETRRLREFAARNRLPHRFLDLEQDRGAELLVRRVGIAPEDTPVVLWAGEVLRNPTNAELAGAVGLRSPVAATDVYDVVVVGAGPAGLAVAVYGASEGLDTMVLDAAATGGQAATSSRIENYLGFPAGLSGSELAERATVQAERFGAHINVPVTATALTRTADHLVVHLDDGSEVPGRTVVVASGSRYRKPDVPRLAEYEGLGVYYAATHLEAWTCRGDPVVILGGGNSAGQAAVFLSRTASEVHLVVRGEDLAADMSRYLADRIERCPSITVHLCTVLRAVAGRRVLESIEVEDLRTGARRQLETRALFVFIGSGPDVGWISDVVTLDDRGFIVTGANLETCAAGVFAVGDVRSGSVKRVAAAVGEGSMVVRFIHDHLDRCCGRTRL